MATVEKWECGLPYNPPPFGSPNSTTYYNWWKAERDRRLAAAVAEHAPDFATEKAASALLRRIFDNEGWTYEEQVRTKSGKAIDFVVEGRDIYGVVVKFGVECKRKMTKYHEDGLAATVLADYLEQAAAYSRDLEMPVFIGPVLTNRSPSSMHTGGRSVESVCALNIFGGRLNVGTLVVNNARFLQWFMILRGAAFWQSGKFNQSRLNMVCSTGSKKERRSINDSQDSVVVLGAQGLQELPPPVQRSQGSEAVCKETNQADAVWNGSAFSTGELRQGRNSTAEELRDVPQATRPAKGDGWN